MKLQKLGPSCQLLTVSLILSSLDPVLKMSTLSKSIPPVPSDDSCQDNVNLKLFLADDTCRFFYNKLLNLATKYSKACSDVWFIEKCIQEEVIPKIFRVSNKPPSQDDDITAQWNSATQNTSTEWMKITHPLVSTGLEMNNYCSQIK